MVPAVNPVMLQVKLPVPLPLVVWLLLVVGLWFVLQQTPRAVTVAPPSWVTLPPQLAEVELIEETEDVVTVGIDALVVKLTSLPYAVPTLFWA